MPSLLIDDLDPALHERLLERAAAHHRAPEVEARLLLQSALAAPAADAPGGLLGLAQRLFGPEHGIELDLLPREAGRPPPDFTADAG